MPTLDILEDIRDAFYEALGGLQEAEYAIQVAIDEGELNGDEEGLNNLQEEIQGVCYLLRKYGYLD